MRRYSSAQDVLRNVFGYEEFRGHQKAVIECVLNGQDALVIMPTGGGKSLCYQIPALLLPGVTVVISPLISLMQDQVQKLRSFGVRAAYCHSQMSPQSLRELYQTMDSGELDLLYLSPERLLQTDMLERMDRLTLGLFAIDEAHCVTVWGEDFRPEYQQLSLLKERYPSVPRLACTATASPAMREEIASILLTSPRSFVASFKRPNLFYRVFHKRSFYTVIECLERHPGQNGIIYCNKRSSAEALAELLAREGFNVAVYHAGLEYEAREALLHRFQNEPDLVIVATIAFGMGIDKGSIRFVMLFDMPRSPEMYMQQLGRAGRDGLPAEVILFASRADYVQQMAVLQKEGTLSPELFQKQKQRLEAMMSIAMTDHCHEASLLAYFGDATED